MLELYQRCGFSLYSALFSTNKWDGDRERDRTRGKRGNENGWKRETELVLEPFVEANLERAAIILFFRREPAASHGNQIEYTNSRGLKCDLSQICGDLDGARARVWTSNGCRRLNNRRGFYLTRKITRILPSFRFQDRLELACNALWIRLGERISSLSMSYFSFVSVFVQFYFIFSTVYKRWFLRK